MTSSLFSLRGFLLQGILAAIAVWMIGAVSRNWWPNDNNFDFNFSKRSFWPPNHLQPRRDISAELGPRLSAQANLYFPGSDGYEKGTTRWSTLGALDIDVVVEVATEEDVAETVKYANCENIPFIATTSSHGAISSLDGVKHGIQIWLRNLNSVIVSDDGDTAEIGGGSFSKGIIDELWKFGKQTVTGGCECVGLVGPALGGGHGWLQGFYGLIADQFVSLRMVLADGTLTTIDWTSDLWWAVKGAGHNFGIVTSVTSKIYDIPNDGLWSYASFIFRHDKVEEVYDTINRVFLRHGAQPEGVINYSLFLNDHSIDPDHPVIGLYILQSSVDAVESIYTNPFNQLDPEIRNNGTGTYRDLAGWTGNSNDAPVCQNAGLTNLRFPVNLQFYDPAAQREVFDTFAAGTQKESAFYNSLYLFEGYPLQGVKAVSEQSTAFPHRQDNVLVSPVIIFDPEHPGLDHKAKAFGEKLRDIVFEASGQEEFHAYVNYAHGDEGSKSWYGYEEWRQYWLQELKKKYDPEGRFNYYAPIE